MVIKEWVRVLDNEQKIMAPKGERGLLYVTTASSSFIYLLHITSNISIIVRLIQIQPKSGRFDSYLGEGLT